MIKILYTRIHEASSRKKVRQKEHDAALRLLHIGLKDLGIQDAKIEFSVTGKPFLAQSEIHFNLTHSGGLCACVIADHPVGIDVEKITERSEASIARIAERMFSPAERASLQAAEDPLLAFYEIWVKKESIVKCSGEGIKNMPLVDSVEAEASLFRLKDAVLAIFPAVDYDFVPQEILL